MTFSGKESACGKQRIWHSHVEFEILHWEVVAISEMGADSVTDGPWVWVIEVCLHQCFWINNQHGWLDYIILSSENWPSLHNISQSFLQSPTIALKKKNCTVIWVEGGRGGRTPLFYLVPCLFTLTSPLPALVHREEWVSYLIIESGEEIGHGQLRSFLPVLGYIWLHKEYPPYIVLS